MKYNESIYGKVTVPENPLSTKELYQQINIIYCDLSATNKIISFALEPGEQVNISFWKNTLEIVSKQLSELQARIEAMQTQEGDVLC